jgi:hypothetical protein
VRSVNPEAPAVTAPVLSAKVEVRNEANTAAHSTPVPVLLTAPPTIVVDVLVVSTVIPAPVSGVTVSTPRHARNEKSVCCSLSR